MATAVGIDWNETTAVDNTGPPHETVVLYVRMYVRSCIFVKEIFPQEWECNSHAYVFHMALVSSVVCTQETTYSMAIILCTHYRRCCRRFTFVLFGYL